jgi:hypothetical protein
MPRYEVAIVKTNDDGSREAVVLHSRPTSDAPGEFGVGFLWNYLRTTRKKDAPPFFQFGVIEDSDRRRVERVFREGSL